MCHTVAIPGALASRWAEQTSQRGSNSPSPPNIERSDGRNRFPKCAIFSHRAVRASGLGTRVVDFDGEFAGSSVQEVCEFRAKLPSLPWSLSARPVMQVSADFGQPTLPRCSGLHSDGPRHFLLFRPTRSHEFSLASKRYIETWRAPVVR